MKNKKLRMDNEKKKYKYDKMLRKKKSGIVIYLIILMKLPLG